MASIALNKKSVDLKPEIKLVYGVGYNSRGKHKSLMSGKDAPAYYTWHNMIRRCYNHETQLRQPAYIGCIVSDAWHDFQVFAEWFYGHSYSALGYHLDKDVLIADNKVYSPETCCFIPQEINKVLNHRAAGRGKYPQGVSFHNQLKRFTARLNINGKQKSLGMFDCPNEAHQAYVVAKVTYVKDMALEWRDRIADNVFQALMAWELPNLDNN